MDNAGIGIGQAILNLSVSCHISAISINYIFSPTYENLDQKHLTGNVFICVSIHIVTTHHHLNIRNNSWGINKGSFKLIT